MKAKFWCSCHCDTGTHLTPWDQVSLSESPEGCSTRKGWAEIDTLTTSRWLARSQASGPKGPQVMFWGPNLQNAKPLPPVCSSFSIPSASHTTSPWSGNSKNPCFLTLGWDSARGPLDSPGCKITSGKFPWDTEYLTSISTKKQPTHQSWGIPASGKHNVLSERILASAGLAWALEVSQSQMLNSRPEQTCMHTEKELPLQISFFFSFLF